MNDISTVSTRTSSATGRSVGPASAWISASMILLGLACSSDDGTGTVRFTTWGEELIEEEIPASKFADGWRVKYEKFLVNFAEITVADDSGSVAASLTGTRLVNHVNTGVKTLVDFPLSAKAYPHVSYRIVPVTAEATLVSATDEDKTTMLTGGFSVYVAGEATKGETKKSFRWGFPLTTLYDRCKGDYHGKEIDGVLSTNGGTDVVELTVHGDHLFYDDLQSRDAVLRFDHIAAADQDADGIVTLDELARVKLAAIPTGQGSYGVGSASGVDDLGAFVKALSRTVGHFRGEGECVSSAK